MDHTRTCQGSAVTAKGSSPSGTAIPGGWDGCKPRLLFYQKDSTPFSTSLLSLSGMNFIFLPRERRADKRQTVQECTPGKDVMMQRCADDVTVNSALPSPETQPGESAEQGRKEHSVAGSHCTSFPSPKNNQLRDAGGSQLGAGAALASPSFNKTNTHGVLQEWAEKAEGRASRSNNKKQKASKASSKEQLRPKLAGRSALPTLPCPRTHPWELQESGSSVLWDADIAGVQPAAQPSLLCVTEPASSASLSAGASLG